MYENLRIGKIKAALAWKGEPNSEIDARHELAVLLQTLRRQRKEISGLIGSIEHKSSPLHTAQETVADINDIPDQMFFATPMDG